MQRVPRARTRAVAEANRLASAMTVDQTRDVFASRVAESLEGGRSAILRPERRSTLVDLATRMGIRAFDAHLVIALTQDAARRGEVSTGRAGCESERADAQDRRSGQVWVIAASLVMGVSGAMFGIAWLIGG